ncbi:MAG: hypothetical protein ABIH21_05495 [Patescibacteria group bacterium]
MEQENNDWSESLKLITYCPLCESKYKPMSARVVREQGQTHLMHMTCNKCKNSILAVVLVNQIGASSVGIVTDLSYDDVLNFETRQRIVTDDVINVHAYFNKKGWQNDFVEKSLN